MIAKHNPVKGFMTLIMPLSRLGPILSRSIPASGERPFGPVTRDADLCHEAHQSLTGTRAPQAVKALLLSGQEKYMPLTEQPVTEQAINERDAGKQPSCVNALENVERNMFSSGPVELASTRYRGAKRLMYPVCGEVKDVDGTLWDVRDVRDTRHGFDLCFGTPAGDHGAFRGGLPRLIATEPLRDFWEANQIKGHGFLFDLPAGRTTLKRVRRRLGFNQRDDTRDFFADRVGELESLPVREFAARHGVARAVACDWRRRILGKRTRPSGWWRRAKFLRVLHAGLTLIETGRRLGIGISHAKRLRDRARLEAQLLGTAVDLKVSLVSEGRRGRV